MSNLVTNNELEQKLKQESGIVEWRMLKPHYERGALIITREGLDIITAGVQIASDNRTQVEHWIDDQSLIKPTPEQVSNWEQHNTRFRSLVVAPFVLIQMISH